MAKELPDDVMWNMDTDTVFSIKPFEELSKATQKFITLYNQKTKHQQEREKTDA